MILCQVSPRKLIKFQDKKISRDFADWTYAYGVSKTPDDWFVFNYSFMLKSNYNIHFHINLASKHHEPSNIEHLFNRFVNEKLTEKAKKRTAQ